MHGHLMGELHCGPTNQNFGWVMHRGPADLPTVTPYSTGYLQLLEILEISWNLKTLLEISWNLNGPPGNFCVMIDRIGIRS